MAGAHAPDNREPAMSDVHLLPRRIALLLLLADLIGLILAFNLALYRLREPRSAEGIVLSMVFECHAGPNGMDSGSARVR